MRTHPESFRVPVRLHKELEKLRVAGGYKNLSRFWIGLGIRAVQDARRKVWVREIANADPNLRDYLIDQMLNFPLTAREIARVIKQMERVQHDGSGETPRPGRKAKHPKLPRA